jgi:hypothetical protein
MHVLELKNPDTGATHGFLVLTRDNTRARRVPYCEKAAHFQGAPTAALIRDRFPQLDGFRTTVTQCTCPIGAHYAGHLRDA